MADISEQIATLIQGMDLSDSEIETLTQNLLTLNQNTLLEQNEDISRAKEGARVTRRGLDLMAKANAGKELHFTRVAFGDSTLNGQITNPTDEQCRELNDLIHWRMDLPMADVSFTGAGTATIRFSVQNQNIEQGFFIRELGVFALDPDTGDEVLYCYRNSGIFSDYLPAGGGAIIWNFIMSVVTVVDQASNITAIIDANLAFVSQAEFSEHINSTNPHPNCPSQAPEITVTPYFWASGVDSNLHPLNIDNAKKIILGGDAVDIPKIDRRVRQVEINLANLFMQLQADNELGMKANLLLIEDFKDSSGCDTYSCKVLSQVAGVANVNLEHDKGILLGRWYTITDGINSEFVQVKSIAKNADKFVVIFNQKLVHTYNLDNTTLIRSSVLISDGMAYGAGDLRGTTYNYSDTWRGIGSNLQTVLMLETTQKNSAAFDLSGDAAFTVNGEFTLSA